MSQLILNEQASAPSTPAASKVAIYVDNTATPLLKMVDDLGTITTQLDSKNRLLAKGDLITASAANTPSTLTVGADGKVLAANAAAASGLAWVDPVLNKFSTATVSAGYASDTYLAGSNVVATAGNWRAGTMYYCAFDMVKTAAGTATPVLTLRMGTLGTTGDASIQTLTFGVGTAAADTALFEVFATFRTVGSGTSAVVQALCRCTHHLAATGMTTTGASGTGIILGTSAGFNSTTQTNLGISFNGGASFSGTNTLVQARAYNLNV